MALESKKSILYKDSFVSKKALGRPVIPGIPSSGNRISGAPTDVLSTKTSFYKPNFSTNSGVSGNISSGTASGGGQGSPSQTLPLQLIKTGYFDGEYFVSGYYEQ